MTPEGNTAQTATDALSRVCVQPAVSHKGCEAVAAQRGVSKAEIAALAGVRRQSVCDYLAGRMKKCGRGNRSRIQTALVQLGILEDPKERRRRRQEAKYRGFHGAAEPEEKWSMERILHEIACRRYGRKLAVTSGRGFIHPVILYHDNNGLLRRPTS